MTEQFNITKARELHAAATPGKWFHVIEQPECDEVERLHSAMGLKNGETLASGENESFLVDTPGGDRRRINLMADEYRELERLREFEAAVILATHWEPVTCKRIVWDARQTLAVSRGELQG